MTLLRRLGRLDDQVSDPVLVAKAVYSNSVIKLRAFLHECRQLGRSYALILAAEALKEELARVLMLFHHNAATLALPLRLRTPDQTVNEYNRRTLNNEDIPDRLLQLAARFEDLRERLNEYRQHTVRD